MGGGMGLQNGKFCLFLKQISRYKRVAPAIPLYDFYENFRDRGDLSAGSV